MSHLYTGVTITFEQLDYTIKKPVESFEVCAVITEGQLERTVVVMFTTNDGTAVGML